MDTTTSTTASPTNVLTLRNVLLLDAVLTGVNGARLRRRAPPHSARCSDRRPAVIVGLGVFMLAYAAAAAWLGTRHPVSRLAVGLIADGNIVWAVASVAVVASAGSA